MFDDYQTGSVILYDFLWNREHEHGLTNGLKQRQSVVVSNWSFVAQMPAKKNGSLSGKLML